MLKLRCIIVEDQPPAQRILKKYISDLPQLELSACFADAIEALAFLKKEKIDLIFLDIHLPKISGLDFIKSLSNPPKIILTTAFPDYALESYDLDVVDYLLKPFSFQRFVKAVTKVPMSSGAEAPVPGTEMSSEKDCIFIKSGHEHIRITIDDILYIVSDTDYTEIVTIDKKHLSSESLKGWLNRFNNLEFFQIHKSYLVNGKKIQKVSGNKVFLGDKLILPIGRAYKESFRKKFLKI